MTEEEQAVGPGGDEEDFSETIHQTFMTLQEYPRKKFESASEAEENFKRAVLEASAELAYDFNVIMCIRISSIAPFAYQSFHEMVIRELQLPLLFWWSTGVAKPPFPI